ncbi:MAG: sulfur transferase domain-containing protein [Gammaproteobacteria bacterium]
MNTRQLSIRRAGLFAAVWALAAFSVGHAFAQSTDLPSRKDAVPGITTAGQPSADQLAAAAKSGIKTVIDLRGLVEDRGLDERATVEKLGMSYVTLPVEGGNGVTYANATALDKLLATAKGPVLVHCATGNRAGALLALRDKLNGADNESALALGVASGLTGLKPVVEKKLAQGHD